MEHSGSFLDWLSHHLFSCPFKSYFGFDCPGCGFQRAIIALLKGDFINSFKFYPAAIPLIFIAIFTLVHLKVDFKIGAQVIKLGVIGIGIIIFINYFYKTYTHQLIS